MIAQAPGSPYKVPDFYIAPSKRPIPVYETKTPAEALEHAARYIEEHGWAKGNFRLRDGSACALGAIMMVAGPEIFGEAHDYLRRYLWRQHNPKQSFLDRLRGKNTPKAWNGIPNWNDTQKSQGPVIAALRGAAKLAAS